MNSKEILTLKNYSEEKYIWINIPNQDTPICIKCKYECDKCILKDYECITRIMKEKGVDDE
jgi:hypothetical protein